MAVLSPHVVWTAAPDGEIIPVDEGWEKLTGAPPKKQWAEQVHPDEADDIAAVWKRSMETGETFDHVHRIRTLSGEYRWMHGRGYPFRNSAGEIVYWYGTTEDIHDRVQAETELNMLHREVDHRARNLMSVVLGLIKLAPRDNVEDFIEAVEQRVMSLADTYTLMAESHWESVNMGELLRRELAPYSNVEITGGDVQLNGRFVQSISMILHELATNAAKYGGLSTRTGGLRVHVATNDERGVVVTWVEHGGPLCSHPNHQGFGSKLISANTTRGCTVERDWDADGLRVILTIPRGHCQTAN